MAAGDAAAAGGAVAADGVAAGIGATEDSRGSVGACGAEGCAAVVEGLARTLDGARSSEAQAVRATATRVALVQFPCKLFSQAVDGPSPGRSTDPSIASDTPDACAGTAADTDR